MIIGIDVGGTHADGVLLDGGKIAAKKKVMVNHDRLGESIIQLLESLVPHDRERLQRIHLSTTLCTNALVKNELDAVGMFVQAGPGTNPDFLNCGENVYFLSGAVDHRGKVVKQPDVAEIETAAEELKKKNITSLGIVTKFSHRNNAHELLVAEKLGGDFQHLSLGHKMSGMPNFPRRVYTTWLNGALKSTFYRFREAMEEGFRKLEIDCPCYILKADGGTIPFDSSCEFPCQSVHSGPSASVMGALALVEDIGDAILLDIGGTTTDIGLYADSVPLLEPYGTTIAGRPTLVRALLTKSIGLGGDSSVSMEADAFVIGPERKGAPMALGGGDPTPTDAMILLGEIEAGSQEKAAEAMRRLIPEGDIQETAQALLKDFARRVYQGVQGMIEEVFCRPVYTVSAFLEREKIDPSKIITIGGPAKALRNILERQFGRECVVPDDYEVANALGSARARLTVQASLYGDTAARMLSIPEISCMEKTGRWFEMADAEQRLREAVKTMAAEMGEKDIPEIDFVERLEMNTVRGFSSTGKIISLKAQIRPGLAPEEE